jgi:hypothetical protein
VIRSRQGSGPAPILWTPGLCRPVLLMPLALEGQRTEEPERRMAPLPIVEDLDVLEDRAPRRGARGPARVVDELDLERGEEALRHRVVPAVAPPTHAADDPLAAEGRLVVAARAGRPGRSDAAGPGAVAGAPAPGRGRRA